MVELKFLILLGVALYFIFKPSIKRIDFIMDGEKMPLDALDYYRGLLKLNEIGLSPEVLTEAYYKQRFKIINNYQPGDASLKELEAAKEYLLQRCIYDTSLN